MHSPTSFPKKNFLYSSLAVGVVGIYYFIAHYLIRIPYFSAEIYVALGIIGIAFIADLIRDKNKN